MNRYTRVLPLLSLAGALALAGCASNHGDAAATSATSAPAAKPATPTETKVHKLASGLVYEDVLIGDGKMADPGLTVSVHYTGTFTDGRKFDSSLDRGQPYTFELGSGSVIRGWDEGIKGMRVGGKRKLTIPSDLAYGAAGRGQIPPNTTLLFDVELVGVQ